MIKKGIVVGVILLFFGIAIAPGINGVISQEPREDEYVEYTMEMCGYPGLKPQTVKLTTQQASEVEDLFDSFKSRSNNATSRDEAVVIARETVIEFNNIGLLDDSDADDVLHRIRIIGSIQKMLCNNHQLHCSLSDLNVTENMLCLIMGYGTSSICFEGNIDRVITRIAIPLHQILQHAEEHNRFMLYLLCKMIGVPLEMIAIVNCLFTQFFPLPVFYSIGLGIDSSPA